MGSCLPHPINRLFQRQVHGAIPVSNYWRRSSRPALQTDGRIARLLGESVDRHPPGFRLPLVDDALKQATNDLRLQRRGEPLGSSSPCAQPEEYPADKVNRACLAQTGSVSVALAELH